jgi:hypothetical protein
MKEGIEPTLYEDINKVLSREWMGSPDSRDSPIYNLKKIYGLILIVIVAFIKGHGNDLETVLSKTVLSG